MRYNSTSSNYSSNSSENITNLDSVRADVEHADRASDEVADGFEVHAADAPGAVDQQHYVGLRWGLTLNVCREMVGRGEAVSERAGTPPASECPPSFVWSVWDERVKCGKKGRGSFVGYIRE